MHVFHDPPVQHGHALPLPPRGVEGGNLPLGQGKLVGTVNKHEVTKDEVLAMIIIGKMPGEVSTEEIEEINRFLLRVLG